MIGWWGGWGWWFTIVCRQWNLLEIYFPVPPPRRRRKWGEVWTLTLPPLFSYHPRFFIIPRFNSLIEFNFMNFHFRIHIICLSIERAFVCQHSIPGQTSHWKLSPHNRATAWVSSSAMSQGQSRNNIMRRKGGGGEWSERMNSFPRNSGPYCLLLSNLCSLNNFSGVPLLFV